MRLFVALDLPDDVRRALGDLIAELRAQCPGARWARPEGMHLTLKFLGHVNDDPDARRLASIQAALSTIRSNAPVNLRFRGIGFFPDSRRPRVIWCGIDATPNLAQLAADIESVLKPLGFAPENRDFVPHLTLARLEVSHRPSKANGLGADREKLAQATEEMNTREFGSARVTEFHLFESILKPSGAQYRKIETYSFVKASP